MALVSLAAAKDHLRITAATHDGDVWTKVEQASGIILDYLKQRLTAIASVSVANPAVITTSGPHSLVSGVSYTIGGTTTTPTINGSQVVTVASQTTFTVPVDVTVGQSEAAGTVGTPMWTEANVPMPVQAATLLMLTHLYEHRGDDPSTDEELWMAIARLLMRSRDPAMA